MCINMFIYFENVLNIALENKLLNKQAAFKSVIQHHG